MKQLLYMLISAVTLGFSLPSCTDLEEDIFNKVSSSEYYKDETSVKNAVASIYETACMGYVEFFMYLAEFPADQIAWRVWNGGGWGYDNGEKYVLSIHNWNSNSTIIRQTWSRAWTAIGQCNLILADLEKISPESIGMTAAQINSYKAEARMLRAWAYYNVFEVWGGAIPIYTSDDISQLPASASADGDFNSGCKKVYNFIMEELDACVNDLPKGKVERMNQAMNRVLKARLLLNAPAFIQEDHFAECATLCESIVGGTYGTYSLATDYRAIFSTGNQDCPEVIFAYATGYGRLNSGNTRNMPFLPYNIWEFLGGTYSGASGWNCTCMVPSYDNSGNVQTWGGTDNPVCFLDAPYNDKLGAPYERFNDKDVRKQNFLFDPATNSYNGLFIKGPVLNKTTGVSLKGDADRNKQDLVYVDQVGTFQNKGRKLETVMSSRWGETNSGIRLLKYPMAPGYFDYRDIYEVEFRLSEVVYMLAECRMRAGNANAAKELINSVRKRYFSSADWAVVQDTPGRGFTAFDLDWVLSEWGLEFLYEGRRRRTDLRRFDKFTQGQWWFFGRATEEGSLLPLKRDRKFEWYPIPETALMVNPNLKQNPAYL